MSRQKFRKIVCLHWVISPPINVLLQTQFMKSITYSTGQSFLKSILTSEHGRQDKMNRGLGTMIPRKNMDQSWLQEEQTIFTP